MNILKFWKTILIALIIFAGSITSGKELNKIPFLGIHNIDKCIHFFMYFTLIISLLNSMVKRFTILSTNNKMYSLILVIFFGGIMEFGQYAFTTDRSAELYDMIANSFGAISGLVIYPFLVKTKLINWL